MHYLYLNDSLFKRKIYNVTDYAYKKFEYFYKSYFTMETHEFGYHSSVACMSDIKLHSGHLAIYGFRVLLLLSSKFEQLLV